MGHHLPVVSGQASSLRNDGKRNFVYPADVRGRFTTARRIGFVVLMAIYAILPWIRVGGRPAVFLDVERRSFYLFGAAFNAQDFWMMVFILTGAAFALVYLTAVAGRVWCGWACPQTVFLEGLYRRVERLVEGPREDRIRRDQGPWTWSKTWRKIVVQAAFIAISLLLAHVFLAYFVSLPVLWQLVRDKPSAHPEVFLLVMGLSAILYFNFSWFREQFCVILCPYGRLQSALLDPHSLIIGYDGARGEPRGKAKTAGAGDCVDCNRCVVVCPTGIDIRNGLQMDCIACAACIDACDTIMDKLGRTRGLVRYDSQDGLAGRVRRFFRPRLYVYTALGALGLLAATFAMHDRRSFEANVLRVAGSPYTLDDGVVRNAFTVHIVNKRAERTSFEVAPQACPSCSFIVPLGTVTLDAMGSMNAPVFVSVPRAAFAGEFSVQITVKSQAGEQKVVPAQFLGPKDHIARGTP